MSDTTLQATAAQAALTDAPESQGYIFASRDTTKDVFSGNVLANTSGGSGKAVVSTFTLNGTTYQAGEVAKSDDAYVNAFTIKADGTYLLDINDPYANAVGVNAGYTVVDGNETVSSTLDIAVEGWGMALDPGDVGDIADNDTTTFVDAGEWVSELNGNVLSNTVNKSGSEVKVDSYVINGETYQAGQAATIEGVGSFTLNADGTYSLAVDNAQIAVDMPVVTYSVDNGSEKTNAVLYIDPAPQAEAPSGGDYITADADETVEMTTSQLTGEVLSGAQVGAKGEVLQYVDSYTIKGLNYKVGETAAICGYGNFTLNKDGTYAFDLEGQRIDSMKMPEIVYTTKLLAADGTYQSDKSTLTVNVGSGVTGKAYPEANAEADGKADLNTNHVMNKLVESGNVFDGYDESADRPYIFGFRVDGHGFYTTNQTVDIPNVGLITMNRDGSYSIDASKVNVGSDWSVPAIAFTVSNGYQMSSSTLRLTPSESLLAGKPGEGGDTGGNNGAEQAALVDAGEKITFDSHTGAANEFNLAYDEALKNYAVNGNVLTNASSTLDGQNVGELSVVGFTANGLRYDAGETAHLKNGVFSLNGDGSFAYHDISGWESKDQISYIVSNGSKTVESKLDVDYYFSFKETYLTGEDQPVQPSEIVAGDNRGGDAVVLNGGKDASADLFIGDSYGKAAATDSTISTDDIAPLTLTLQDTFIGDRLNIDSLSWNAGGTTVKGSSYDNSVEGLRDYIRSTLTDAEKAAGDTTTVENDAMAAYLSANYAKLMDTNAQGGNDTITGSDGDDIIIGNAGNDILTGGYGKDNFVFLANSNSGKDTIVDFTKGEDKISFTDLVDTTQLVWDAESSTLNFTGVQGDQSYQNSITIQNGSADLTLNDLLGTAIV